MINTISPLAPEVPLTPLASPPVCAAAQPVEDLFVSSPSMTTAPTAEALQALQRLAPTDEPLQACLLKKGFTLFFKISNPQIQEFGKLFSFVSGKEMAFPELSELIPLISHPEWHTLSVKTLKEMTPEDYLKHVAPLYNDLLKVLNNYFTNAQRRLVEIKTSYLKDHAAIKAQLAREYSSGGSRHKPRVTPEDLEVTDSIPFPKIFDQFDYILRSLERKCHPIEMLLNNFSIYSRMTPHACLLLSQELARLIEGIPHHVAKMQKDLQTIEEGFKQNKGEKTLDLFEPLKQLLAGNSTSAGDLNVDISDKKRQRLKKQMPQFFQNLKQTYATSLLTSNVDSERNKEILAMLQYVERFLDGKSETIPKFVYAPAEPVEEAPKENEMCTLLKNSSGILQHFTLFIERECQFFQTKVVLTAEQEDEAQWNNLEKDFYVPPPLKLTAPKKKKKNKTAAAAASIVSTQPSHPAFVTPLFETGRLLSHDEIFQARLSLVTKSLQKDASYKSLTAWSSLLASQLSVGGPDKLFIQETKEHLLMAAVGIEVLLTATFTLRRPQAVGAIFPTLVLDFHVMLEQLITANYVKKFDQLPLSHSLLKKNHEAPVFKREDEDLLRDLDQGLIWARYPHASQELMRGRKAPILEALHIGLSRLQKGRPTRIEKKELCEAIGLMLNTHLLCQAAICKTLPQEHPLIASFEVYKATLKGLMAQIENVEWEKEKPAVGPLQEQAAFLSQAILSLQTQTKSCYGNPLLELQDAITHLLRIEESLKLQSVCPEPHFNAWFFRNTLNLQWSIEKLYHARGAALDIPMFSHDFMELEAILGSDTCPMKPFFLGKGAHYPTISKLYSPGDPLPALVTLRQGLQQLPEELHLDDKNFIPAGKKKKNSSLNYLSAALPLLTGEIQKALCDVQKAFMK